MLTSPALRSVLALTLAGLSAGCGAHQPPNWTLTMPSPDGCFVQVWNDSGFAGISDFINGPIQYGHLRDLPNRRSWKDRISSLRLGPGASAVAWSGEEFSGQSLLLTSESEERGTFAVLPLAIQSLDIRCDTQVADGSAPASSSPAAAITPAQADASN
jgi:hypothetical protein